LIVANPLFLAPACCRPWKPERPEEMLPSVTLPSTIVDPVSVNVRDLRKM